MIMNVAFWFMKRAVLIAVRPEVTMEDAKEVHSSLRRAAGLVKFVQVGTYLLNQQGVELEGFRF